MPDAPDDAPIPYEDGPSDEEKRQAQIAALRRQQFQGGLLRFGGGPGARAMGNDIAGEATRQLQAMPQMELKKSGLQLALEKLAAQKEHWESQDDNRQTQVNRPRIIQGKDGSIQSIAPGESALTQLRAPTAHAGGSGGMAGGSGGNLSPEALDRWAAQFNDTGRLPQGLGLGKAGTAIRLQIANRASQLAGANAEGLAGANANYGADSKSLASLQRSADATNAFEKTALGNLNNFVQSAHQVVDSGSPLFNMPARAFAEKVAGDPKMAVFNATRETAINEIGKVLSGSVGSAGVTEGARKEASSLLGHDASLAQIEAAAAILKKDMEVRHKSFDDQLGSIKGRMGGHHGASGTSVKEERTLPDGRVIQLMSDGTKRLKQ